MYWESLCYGLKKYHCETRVYSCGLRSSYTLCIMSIRSTKSWPASKELKSLCLERNQVVCLRSYYYERLCSVRSVSTPDKLRYSICLQLRLTLSFILWQSINQVSVYTGSITPPPNFQVLCLLWKRFRVISNCHVASLKSIMSYI